jgi:hypothetical protein
MNTNFKHVLMACTVLLAGLTSCNKEEQTAGSGEKTTMKLNLSFVQGATRAEDANASAEESAVKTVDVYIFDATSKVLVNTKRLESSEFEESQTEPNKYTNKVSIETTTGAKLVVVGVNVPSDFPTVTSLASLKQAWTTTLANLTNTTNGFVMFSQKEESITLIAEPTGTENTVSTTVERVVAKVTVKKDASFNLVNSEGTFSNLQYTIRQSNKKLFPLQLVLSTTPKVVEDPNYSGAAVATDFENIATFVDVNTGADYETTWSNKYAVENTSTDPTEANSTYAFIKATFVPTKVCKNATTEEMEDNPNGATPTTFYVVKAPGGRTFYCSDAGVASGLVSKFGVPTVSHEYTNGLCYFSAYLNKDNDYSTIRNEFYLLNIKNMVPPGSSENDPTKPDTELEAPTDIDIDVTIAPWVPKTSDYELQ